LEIIVHSLIDIFRSRIMRWKNHGNWIY